MYLPNLVPFHLSFRSTIYPEASTLAMYSMEVLPAFQAWIISCATARATRDPSRTQTMEQLQSACCLLNTLLLLIKSISIL